jgi:hypothetical protein
LDIWWISGGYLACVMPFLITTDNKRFEVRKPEKYAKTSHWSFLLSVYYAMFLLKDVQISSPISGSFSENEQNSTQIWHYSLFNLKYLLN